MNGELLTQLDDLRRRIARLEAQEVLAKTQVLLTTGANTGATSQPQAFTYPVQAPWFDYPVSTDADSEVYNGNTATYPVGWTQVSAAVTPVTNAVIGFWRLSGSATTTTWKYRRKLAADVASGDHSIGIGPVGWQQLSPASNIEYLFGLYRDNSGIDENTFLRIRVQWDSATTIWRVRAERKDGATQTDGAWFNLAASGSILPNPWWFRLVVRATAAQFRAYAGTLPITATQATILSVNGSYTWGTPWLQFELATRPASGNNDTIYIGGVDRTTST